MPPAALAIGAGVASIAGGAIASSGAKKAAKLQQQQAQSEQARLQANQEYIRGLNQPTIDRGNAAGGLIGSFLGTEGGDQAASALATYRGSTGYQDLLNTGLGAVNSNAYARGLGASGATLKALQAKGMALADQNAQGWLGNLGTLANAGQNAIAGVGNAATNTTNAINTSTGNAADASSNAALLQSAGWQRALQNLGNIGSSFAGGGGAGLGSSYGAPQGTQPTMPLPSARGWGGGYEQQTPVIYQGGYSNPYRA